MELLTVLNAKSIWQIESKYLNPRGKNIDRELIEWLKEHYQFQNYPSLPLVDPNKLEFSNGTFETDTPDGKKEKYYVELAIFNDGLIANTRNSTSVSDEFLYHALTFASSEFDLVFRPEMIRNKIYVSELEIRLSRPMRFFSWHLEQFAAKIESYYHRPIRFEFASVGFWPDPSIVQWRPANFQIERKLGSESEDICFSRAPLHTEDHVKLLGEFDSLLISHAASEPNKRV